ncbi:MAG: universal stress protein [Candidatus Neomarinimicrobiota bacterium]
MKILIAISSEQYSGPTLSLGMKISSAFKAPTTIVDVGSKISEFGSKEVSIANQVIESWGVSRPGVEVLEWAFRYLLKNNFIEVEDDEGGKLKNKLIEEESNRIEVYLKGKIGNNLSLILRNGDIIGELRDEVQSGNYDVTIIGGSGKRSMSHDLIQYIDSSILVVKGFDPTNNYRILLVIDDSPYLKKVLKYGVRVAQAFNIEVDFLVVSKNKTLSEENKVIIDYSSKYLRRCNVKSNVLTKIGNPEERIIEAAGNNHIIIMGVSIKSPIAKFFQSSIPLEVMNSCNCPILIVKPSN